MRVDLRGLYILVAQQFLDGADIVTVIEQVGSEGMAERMTADRLGHAQSICGLLDRTVQVSVIPVMASDYVRIGIC